VLRDRARFVAPRERVESIFSLARTADAYEAILAGAR
jgi:hypothetical protein